MEGATLNGEGAQRQREPTSSPTRAPLNRTIREIQQEFAKNLGYKDETIWDLLSAEQGDILKRKIELLIPDHEKHQKTINEMRETLFNSIWAQRKYTNGNSLSYLFFVLVTKESDFNVAPESREFSMHPVFRTRKCVDENGDSSSCCMIYIDEWGRVYPNWRNFTDENVLPAGNMVAPRRGIYNFDDSGHVVLDVYTTPAGTPLGRALNIAETSSSVLAVGATVVTVAGILTPVAAPLMTAAGIAGHAVGAFSFGRSSLDLIDRKRHEQSISLTDKQTRGSWFSVIGGGVGAVASGATRLMKSVAASGSKVSTAAQVFVNGINISSILIFGTSLTDSVFHLILHYDESSTLDILQMSSSLILFTHSVSNFKLASSIVNEVRDATIKNYRDSLSNRQRKMFNKMSKETLRIRGPAQGKIDIIRNINEIPSKQYLNDLYKVNRDLNRKGIRPSFGGNVEGVVLNDQLPVNTHELRQNIQHQQGQNLLSGLTQKIPKTYPANSVASNIQHKTIESKKMPQSSTTERIIRASLMTLHSKLERILPELGAQFFENISNEDNLRELLQSMVGNIAEDVLGFFMQLAEEFIRSFRAEVNEVLKSFISTESALYRILKYCLDHYSVLTVKFLYMRKSEIIAALKSYYMSLSPDSPKGLLKRCQICKGEYAICSL